MCYKWCCKAITIATIMWLLLLETLANYVSCCWFIVTQYLNWINRNLILWTINNRILYLLYNNSYFTLKSTHPSFYSDANKNNNGIFRFFEDICLWHVKYLLYKNYRNCSFLISIENKMVFALCKHVSASI